MKDITNAWPGLAGIVKRLDLHLTGVGGAPGSGKSTLTRAAAAELDDALVMSTDDYYLPKAERRGAFRRTHDLDALLTALDVIRSGRGPLTVERFEGAIDDRIEPLRLDRVPAHVLLEGFAVGRRSDGYERILERLDLFVFVDIDEQTARERRFAREADLRARGGGFSEDEMQRFWDEVLYPGMKDWLDDARDAADVVIEAGARLRVLTRSSAVSEAVS